MRVLALDTTTTDGSIAIADDARVIIARAGDGARSHTQRLPGDMLGLLADASLNLREIDLFAVIAGPGSFTGLRTGIAAIQGLAVVQGKRVVAVSALDALGHAASDGRAPGAIVGAWMNAHRGEVFSTLYRVGAASRYERDALVEVEPARVGTPLDTLSRWRDGPGLPEAIAGDGATLYAECVSAASVIMPHPLLAPIAAQMAVAQARQGLTLDPAGVQPIYVRRPDVEMARDAKRERDAAAMRPPSVR